MSSQWETFCDECYYHMWRLRRENERGWNDGFHINTRDEAQALCKLLNKLEGDLNDYRNMAFQSEHKLEEAQQQLLVKRSNNRRLDARNKRLELELTVVTEQRDRLAEALRKAVQWADCASIHMENRHEINWTHLNEANEGLAAVKGGQP